MLRKLYYKVFVRGGQLSRVVVLAHNAFYGVSAGESWIRASLSEWLDWLTKEFEATRVAAIRQKWRRRVASRLQPNPYW